MGGWAREARITAMRAVFAALSNPDAPRKGPYADLPEGEEERRPPKSRRLTREILAVFARHQADIEALMTKASHYALEDVSLTERAVICTGTAELLARPQTPVGVILSEFVAIARQHGAERGVKYVNAVLDRIARSIRTEPEEARRTWEDRDNRDNRGDRGDRWTREPDGSDGSGGTGGM